MSNYCITLEYGVFTSFIWMVIYVDKYVSKRICTEDFAIVVWITLFVCRTGNISCASLTIPSDIRSIRLCCTSALQYRLVQASWTIIIDRSFTLLDWFDGFSAVLKCLYFFSNWKLDCCLAPNLFLDFTVWGVRNQKQGCSGAGMEEMMSPYFLYEMDVSPQYFCPQNPCNIYIIYIVLILSAYWLKPIAT